jgi:hypothetical protein
VLPTKYIEYDYNFLPNVASVIHFKNASKLGDPYHLTYDSAKVDLKINTMRWYGLSAPLRDMYSGDYMFPHANPLTEMRLYHETNPQTNVPPEIDWTTPFNNTNIRLNAGMGYSLRVGRLYYNTVDDVTGADINSSITIPNATFFFPSDKMSFQFYNELNKKPVAGRIEYIPEHGRDFRNRFIYEITEEGINESIVPKRDTLVAVPIKADGNYVIVGNPFMSHLDFAEFYRINYERITPGYRILDGSVSVNNISSTFISLSGLDSEENGEFDEPVVPSAPGDLSLKSIPPMQTFFVEKRGNPVGDSLYITKAMSTVDEGHSLLRAPRQENNVLRIKVSNANSATYAAVALSDRANNEYVLGEDSRRILGSGIVASPNVYTITDGMYLDVNWLKEFPAALPIGISTTSKGNMTLELTGLNALPGTYNYVFKDTKTPQTTTSLNGKETFSYEFDNTEGDQIGRFYILREMTDVNNPDIQENIQIYVRQNVLHILSSDGTEINEVVIYSADGLTLGQRNNIKNTHVEIPISQWSKSVLVVKAHAAQTTKVAKIIVAN